MILVENNVVVAIFESYEERPNGYLINGAIYPIGKLVNVVAPSDVVEAKYCYTSDKGFYLNPDYKVPTPSIDEIYKELCDLVVKVNDLYDRVNSTTT